MRSEPRPRAIKGTRRSEGIRRARESARASRSAEASESARTRGSERAREDLLELGGKDASLEAGRKASRRWRALVHGASCSWRGLRLAALVPSWPTGALGRCGRQAARRGQVACYFLVLQLVFPPS